MLGGINSVTNEIARVYTQNNARLSEILQRIASGKKMLSPSDNFAGYARASALKVDVEGYEQVAVDLTEAKSVSRTAELAGEGIYEDLTRMKTLIGLYYDADGAGDADAAATYKNEFDSLLANVQDTIDNTTYEASAIVDSAFSYEVDMDPEGTGTLTITFDAQGGVQGARTGDIVDVSTVGTAPTIGDSNEADELTLIDDQITVATNYLMKAENYTEMIDRQITITNTIIESKNAAISLIEDIDEAEEMAKATEMEIRQKASIAMLAQANMLRGTIGDLYKL